MAFLRNGSKREEVRQAMMNAMQAGDMEAWGAAFDNMANVVGEEVRADMEQRFDELSEQHDAAVLSARGVRQLTTEEKKYFTNLLGVMRADGNQKQLITNLEDALPSTTIDAVFEDLRQNHPLLSAVDFRTDVPYGMKVVFDASGRLEAVWTDLCDDIETELGAELKVVDATLQKLAAFIVTCKPGMELGPEWLERYVRELLVEAYANGMEKAIVDGTGNKQPIGMTRSVADDVAVVGGVYPQKEQITVNDLDAKTVLNLIGLMAVDPNGKARNVENVVLVVNSVDYYTKVLPAVATRDANGNYNYDALPYPMTIIPTPYLTVGDAVIGMGKRYFAAAGVANGRIEYSDEQKFTQDKRIYMVKGYANGFPKDDNAFLFLDISGMRPYINRVAVIDDTTPNDDATLAMLSLNLELSEDFDPEEDTYTATATTGGKSVLRAIPADAAATLVCALGDTVIANGSEITWAAGSNVVTVTVTAEDGETTETYTVTVTAS